MNSKFCHLSAKNAQYFEDMQFPESKFTGPTEKGKNVFPVNITSANRSDTFPAIQCCRQDNSENQTYGAKKEGNVLKATIQENLQSEGNHATSTYHELSTPFEYRTFPHHPQFIQQHEGNLFNLNCTPPREVMKDNTMCSMLSNVNAIMIQPAYLAICPFLNSNLISLPQVYHYVPQHPHYHNLMFQPFSGILPTPQTISYVNCQPRMYSHDPCKSCQSERVPVKTKEFIKEYLPKSAQNNRLNPKKKENVRKKLMSTSIPQMQKDECSENVTNTAELENPHLCSMMNSSTIKSNPLEESEYPISQKFQDWKGNSMSIKEYPSLESNDLEECIDRLENSNEEIPNVRYMNHYLPHTDLRLNENHQTIVKKRTECDGGEWKKNQKEQSCRMTSDFKKEDYLFPCSSTLNKSPSKPLEQNKDLEDAIKLGNFLRNKLHKLPDNGDSQALNVTTRVSQRNEYKENSSVCSKSKKNNQGEFLKDKLDLPLKDNTLSNDTGNKRNLDLEREKFSKSNLNAKLLAERPVIFQNGIQEMNITISHKDTNGKEGTECKYHTCKKVNKVCCPSIKKKETKSREYEENQLEPEEAVQIRESISSYPPNYLKKTKAIINFVLQQLQENRKKYKGEANLAQNLHVERNTCNNHVDSQHYMNITDDGKYIIDYNDEQKSFMSSISQRNLMNQKDLANAPNEESLQPSTSTTLQPTHFVHSDMKFSSSKDFDSESGIDTD